MSKINLHTKFDRERNKGFLLSTIGIRVEKILAVQGLDPDVRKALQTVQMAKALHDITDRTICIYAVPPIPYDFENDAALLGVTEVDLKITYLGRPPHIDMLQHAQQAMQMAQLNHNHEVRTARNKMNAGIFRHVVHEPVLDAQRKVAAGLFLRASEVLGEKGFNDLSAQLKDLHAAIDMPTEYPVDLYAHDRTLRKLTM